MELNIADLKIDLVKHKVERGGNARIDLSPKEFALLALLAQASRRSVIAHLHCRSRVGY